MKITVDAADRVDKALAKQFPTAGRRQLALLFDEGCVRVAGKLAKKGDRVVIGDVIELSREPVSGDALRPAPDPNVPIEVLLERTDIVVVNKPAGIPSQPLRAGELGTIANGIVHRYPECVEIGAASGGNYNRDGGLVHRLDIGTSGVLVAARTAEAHRALRDAFGAGLVHKDYLALVEARPVSRECDAPLAQRGKRVIVDHTDGLAAYTEFVVERANETHALVRCTAQTGRMHQVRAHLAHVGSPIVGDELYGGHALVGIEGFFLHAAKIVLPDKTVVEAPLPERFLRAIEAVQLPG
jgi:23S rRNA pseudouridine1911/1915/1917 synthase